MGRKLSFKLILTIIVAGSLCACKKDIPVQEAKIVWDENLDWGSIDTTNNWGYYPNPFVYELIIFDSCGQKWIKLKP